MTDLMLLVFAIDLIGVWLYGSAALSELLCQHLRRRTPTGGAAVAFAMLVYVGTYCLLLGILWGLLGTQKPGHLARMPL